LIQITTNISLEHLNSFKVHAKTRAFIQIDHVSQLPELSDEIASYENRLVLGGGSNLLFVSDYDGLVIYPKLKGIQVVAEDNHQIILRVAASENWHEFVQYCLDKKYYGLENLALIPGSVGASPVQNIGAYGVEVESFIQQVECFDLQQTKFLTLSNKECRFSYRDSFIKQAGQGRYLVTSVDFVLQKNLTPVLSYKPLQEYFNGNDLVSAKQIFDRVCFIRSQKLPDPKKLANAGSFFKNPIINKEQYLQLKKDFPESITYPIQQASEEGFKVATDYKVAAGWLIEKAGFKGKTFDKVGVHKHQALVLVNYSDTQGKNIWILAQKIMRKVKQIFSIELEVEVRVVGELEPNNLDSD